MKRAPDVPLVSWGLIVIVLAIAGMGFATYWGVSPRFMHP
jgi:hypothetical protein